MCVRGKEHVHAKDDGKLSGQESVDSGEVLQAKVLHVQSTGPVIGGLCRSLIASGQSGVKLHFHKICLRIVSGTDNAENGPIVSISLRASE